MVFRGVLFSTWKSGMKHVYTQWGQKCTTPIDKGLALVSNHANKCMHLAAQQTSLSKRTYSSDERDKSKYEDGLAIEEIKSQFEENNLEDIEKLLEESKSGEVESEPEFPSDLRQFQEWRQQENNAMRPPRVDPQETSILLFPGQGSQFVGMGKSLLPYPNVEEIYNVASEILGYDLLDICLNGPKKELDKTEYQQPAIFVTSLAAVEKLKELKPAAIENCIGAAGFSIGEYAALVFSGAMEFEEALEVVKARAQAMQRASEEVPSGMMSVFLDHRSKVNFACHAAKLYCTKKLGMEDPVCSIANYLFPECKVIAGNVEALEFIKRNSRDFGLRRYKGLPVSGAFHTKLMKPASLAVKSALADINVHSPVISVHSNLTAKRYGPVKSIREQLVKQVFNPVKWEQTMHVLYSRAQGENFPHTYELGPGKQLGTLLKQVNLKAFKSYTAIEV